MKKIIIPAMAIIAILSSCNKETSFQNDIVDSHDNSALIAKSFSVSALETKTSLDSDGINILWSDGDAINIIGVNESGKATSHQFTIESGQGTGSAVFSGTVGADETTFYALYPYNKASLSSDVMTSDNINPSQTAAEGSFDPSAAEMVAVADENDNLVFSHGRAYIKFTMGSDNVASVRFTSENSKIAAKSKYNMPACTINSTGGDQQTSVTLNGPFSKGSSYYVAIAPHKNTIGSFTVQYNFSSGAISTKTTSGLSNIKPVDHVGKVLNLGTIAMSPCPFIEASDLQIDADDEIGAISFSVSNLIDGGVASYSVDSNGLSNSSWNTIVFDSSTGAGSISFSCDPNDDANNVKEAVVTITYTYNTNETVTKTITITQKKAVASGSTTYYYYNTGSVTNTDNMFNTSTSFVTFDGTSNNCGVSSFKIDGITVTKGLKLDGSGYLEFTTPTEKTASVTFYYVCRKESANSSAIIKITPINPAGTATEFGNFNQFGTINSQTVSLNSGTLYRIARSNNELVLVYVALTISDSE